MSAPEVGRRIAWREVPDRALVAVETQGGRLYALRSGSRGHYVGGPASWVGEDEEPSWSWFHGSTDGDPLVVALSVPAQASADHLRGLAKVFEVREALVIDTLDQTVGVVLKDGGERDRAERPDPAETRGELMRLAGLRDLVDAERERNKSRVRARHVDMKETTT